MVSRLWGAGRRPGAVPYALSAMLLLAGCRDPSSPPAPPTVTQVIAPAGGRSIPTTTPPPRAIASTGLPRPSETHVTTLETSPLRESVALAAAADLERAGLLTEAMHAYASLARLETADGTVTPPFGAVSMVEVAASGAWAALARRTGDVQQAAQVLESLLEGRTYAELPSWVVYELARARESTGQHAAAAQAFRHYAGAEPSMAATAHLAEGAALVEAGMSDAAVTAYSAALAAAPTDEARFLAAIRQGNTLLAVGRPGEADKAYTDAYAAAADGSQKAQALAGQIAAWQALGDRPSSLRLTLLRDAPNSPQATVALDALVGAGEEVDPALAAEVRLSSGQAGEAAVLFDQAATRAAEPAEADRLRLRSAEALLQSSDSDSGLKALAELATASTDPDVAGQAALRTAQALRRAGSPGEGQALEFFLARWPGHPAAPEAALRYARLATDLVEAERRYVAAATRDPASGAQARFLAGLSAWRLGNVAAAISHWAAVAAQPSPEAGRAAYWLGRTHADAGRSAEASTWWTRAVEADPDRYYGILAAQALGRLALDETLAHGPAPNAGLVALAPAEAAVGPTGRTPMEIEPVWAWLSSWSAVPETQMADIAAMPETRRARAWLELRDRRAALRNMRALLRAKWDDPAALAAIAFVNSELDLIEPASSAAERVLRLAPAGTEEPPLGLIELAYPAGFSGLVAYEAARHGLPEALLYGLIRQESRFEPTAVSSAGARGLTQVMPDTGRWIAEQLGFPGFETDELYRPVVSVRFGAYYLYRQMLAFEGHWWAAVAAYNGGPGNARRWLTAADGDRDLFVELIDLAETRLFVHLVTEHAARYSAIRSYVSSSR